VKWDDAILNAENVSLAYGTGSAVYWSLKIMHDLLFLKINKCIHVNVARDLIVLR